MGDVTTNLVPPATETHPHKNRTLASTGELAPNALSFLGGALISRWALFVALVTRDVEDLGVNFVNFAQREKNDHGVRRTAAIVRPKARPEG